MFCFRIKKLPLDSGENELVLAAFLKIFDEYPFLSGIKPITNR